MTSCPTTTLYPMTGVRDTEWGREMGKKLAEAEARAKQDAATHEKRAAKLEEELNDLRRRGPEP